MKNYCYHYDYLPFKDGDLEAPCAYCKENKRQSVMKNQNSQEFKDMVKKHFNKLEAFKAKCAMQDKKNKQEQEAKLIK